MKTMSCVYMIRFAGAVGAVALASSAAAFQPLITDDTGTQGSAGNQLEFSVNQDRARTGDVTERTRTLPFVYTRGLTDSLDLFVGVSHVRIRSNEAGGDASGAGNSSFGAKWRFFENEESGTSLALKPEVVLPVSSGREREGLGTGRSSGALTLILSQEVPFGAVHVNLGAARDRYRDRAAEPDATTYRLSAAPVWDVAEGWKLALDLGTESSRAGGSTVRANFVELGAIYSPNEDIDFAFGAIRQRDDADPRTRTTSVTAGVTWRFR